MNANLADIESRLSALLSEISALKEEAASTLETTAPGPERHEFYSSTYFNLEGAQWGINDALKAIRKLPR